MAELEAGQINAEQAMALLLLDKPFELVALEREGAFKQAGKGRYWLKDVIQGYIRYTREHARDTDTTTLAGVFGMSLQRISQLAHDGWFKQLQRPKRGVYDWAEACGGYIRYLRHEDRTTSKGAADNRMRDAKAHDIEVRTRQRLGRLIPLEVYEEMIDNMAGVVRSEFAGLAAASTRDLTMRRIIEREVNARLRRIAEHGLAQAIRLEKVGGTDDAVRADGAGPVGSSKPKVSVNRRRAGAT